MLIKHHILERIARGEVTLAFRRWRRATVKAGGTLLTGVGQLKITAVDVITEAQLNLRDARRAGYDELDELVAHMAKSPNEKLYRIRFKLLGPDPRIALRENDVLSDADHEQARADLAKIDRRAADGPWTSDILETIRRYPDRSAAELSQLSGREREWLKLNIRKLKNLGLVETRCPGYHLSPRGSIVVMRGLRSLV